MRLVEVSYGYHDVTEEVDGYAHATNITDLEIGDIVEVALSQHATVVKLSSDWTGRLDWIKGIVRRRNPPPAMLTLLDWSHQMTTLPEDRLNPVVGLATSEAAAQKMRNIFGISNTTVTTKEGKLFAIRSSVKMNKRSLTEWRLVMFGVHRAMD